MPAVFSPRANLIARASIALGLLLVCGAGVIAYAYINSSYYNDVNVEIDQPVPFSHEHHVGGLGIDCRYCHASVEESAFAGMPASETCMGCHSKLWTRADLLEPIRSSWQTGTPVRWRRVNVLPDFVYFNHAIHINKGIGCGSCHGPVDKMPLMRKYATLNMRWCIACHRNPEPQVRPRDRIFDVSWKPAATSADVSQLRYDTYDIRSENITDCSTCHR